ncbi:hypothetical protein ACFL6U_13960 [Planctomycetota bacterium]
MDDKTLFVSVVIESRELPADVKRDAEQVKALRPFVFDSALLSLLDAQIRFGTRGSIYANRLRQRKEALLPYCNKPLLKGRIEIGMDAYWLFIHPETKTVVFWERYENWGENT